VTDNLDSVLCVSALTLDTSRDSEVHNGISYTAFEEQWESNSALEVDKLVTSLLRKWPLNVLVPTGELFFVYTHLASFTPT
jgi:hypothetical protein